VCACSRWHDLPVHSSAYLLAECTSLKVRMLVQCCSIRSAIRVLSCLLDSLSSVIGFRVVAVLTLFSWHECNIESHFCSDRHRTFPHLASLPGRRSPEFLRTLGAWICIALTCSTHVHFHMLRDIRTCLQWRCACPELSHLEV
jgi:hypothetical protein